jgi:predicted NBD/HSP70 family sugar kinase
MKAKQTVRVAHNLLLWGAGRREEQESRDALFQLADVHYSTFRSATKELGGRVRTPRLRFFDISQKHALWFGPGAGVCVGVSVGARTVRAVLVDANGWEYDHCELDAVEGQLQQSPDVVMARVRDAVRGVLRRGIEDDRLLVDRKLPLLGCSVAWPTPIDRNRRPVGHALSDAAWNRRQLDERVQDALGLGDVRTFVMSDSHAAALAIAHRDTRGSENVRRDRPRLTIVIRLAGNVSGSVIVIERSKLDQGKVEVSGFVRSILLGGIDNLAGEIGHVPVSPDLVARLNERAACGGLADLPRVRCSCTVDGDEDPEHLEAYASALALTSRLYPDLDRGAALEQIRQAPETEPHRHALEDVGALVGETILAPAAILNPAAIVLTGSLALAPVKKALEVYLKDEWKIGSAPKIELICGDDNENLRAKGAALAMLRVRVHRELETLLGTAAAPARIRALTKRIGESDLTSG